MSSTGSANHNNRLASATDIPQRTLDNNSGPHLRLKERQRFFEEVFQNDVDNYPPSAHLQIDSRKPPMGSISSMEVNVDVLEQMDLMDVADQEALDVFLNSSSGSDDGALTSRRPDGEDEDDAYGDASVIYRERAPLRRQSEIYSSSQCRISSTSSGSSDTSVGGGNTPVIQSDDEEVYADTLLLTSVPQTRDEETEEEDGKRRYPLSHDD